MAFTYSRLASTTVGAGGTSAITFSNIPQNYTDLVVKTSIRTNASATNQAHWIRFNADSRANYSARLLEGSGSAAASYNNPGYTYIYLGEAVGNTATANTFGSTEAYIPNYSSSSQKSVSVDAVSENNATAAYADLVAGIWSNITAINSITILPTSGTILQYSTATLYGIRVEL